MNAANGLWFGGGVDVSKDFFKSKLRTRTILNAEGVPVAYVYYQTKIDDFEIFSSNSDADYYSSR